MQQSATWRKKYSLKAMKRSKWLGRDGKYFQAEKKHYRQLFGDIKAGHGSWLRPMLI